MNLIRLYKLSKIGINNEKYKKVFDLFDKYFVNVNKYTDTEYESPSGCIRVVYHKNIPIIESFFFENEQITIRINEKIYEELSYIVSDCELKERWHLCNKIIMEANEYFLNIKCKNIDYDRLDVSGNFL